jgi:hypothetical protein
MHAYKLIYLIDIKIIYFYKKGGTCDRVFDMTFSSLRNY